MRIMLQYEHSKANIYTYIFQDESKPFLNKLLEFSVYSKERYVQHPRQASVLPRLLDWWHFVVCVFYV